MAQLPQAGNPFLQAARQAMAAPAGGGQFQAVLGIIDEFCQAIEQGAAGTLACVREPGFLTNLGQEYRVLIRTQRRQFEHILCRAHVDPAGLPTMLDLYDEDLTECDTEAVLRRELLAFLNKSTTRDVLRTLAAQ